MKLTKEQALSKYGEVPLKFDSYYKYSFNFSGNADDGASIVISIGGDSDDIYRLDIEASTTITLNEDSYNYAWIRSNGELIYEEKQ